MYKVATLFLYLERMNDKQYDTNAIFAIGKSKSHSINFKVFRQSYPKFKTQMGKNKKAIVPIISIVLNFSDRRWNKPTSLRGIMKLPKELEELVPDYCFRVYDVAFLEDDVIERFTSDFKVVALFFKKKRLGKLRDLSGNKLAIRHVEEILEMFGVFTQDQRYVNLTEEIIRQQKEDEISKG